MAHAASLPAWTSRQTGRSRIGLGPASLARRARRSSQRAPTPAIQSIASLRGSLRAWKRVSRPTRSLSTRPAVASSERCLATAWRVTGRSRASSLAVAWPLAATRTNTVRRVSSARAPKTRPGSVITRGRARGRGPRPRSDALGLGHADARALRVVAELELDGRRGVLVLDGPPADAQQLVLVDALHDAGARIGLARRLDGAALPGLELDLGREPARELARVGQPAPGLVTLGRKHDLPRHARHAVHLHTQPLSCTNMQP